jgi:acyl-CoA thioesterase-1
MTNSAPYVLAFGDSLTAGYGLPSTASFAACLQTALRERFAGTVVHNAGVSGDTTAGGLKRLAPVLTSLTRRPDLVIVELGANDLLRGFPPERTRANLDAILGELARCGLPALLATFEAPPFLAALRTQYRALYAALAAKHGVVTAPFFPPGVLGHPDLVLADRLHPNARAIAMVVDALLPVVCAALPHSRSEAA